MQKLISYLQNIDQVLQAWLISQPPGDADGLDQLVCLALCFREAVGQTLRCSGIETDNGSHLLLAPVSVPGLSALFWLRRLTSSSNPLSGLRINSC